MDAAAVYQRRWWALAVMCISLLVITLDNTILNVALPALIRDTHASTSQLQWVIDGYTLVFAGLLLTTGAAVTDAPEPKKRAPAMPGGGDDYDY